MDPRLNVTRLRIYLRQSSERGDGLPSESLLLLAKREGIASATVYTRTHGFGAYGHVEPGSGHEQVDDFPILVELVDHPDRIARILPLVERIAPTGVTTCEPIDAIIPKRPADLDPVPNGEPVREIMQPGRPVRAGASVSDVVARLAETPAGLVAVLADASDEVLGVITNRDLIARAEMPLRSPLLRYFDPRELPSPEGQGTTKPVTARALMTSPALTIAMQQSEWEAAAQLAATGFTALVVRDAQERYVGIVSVLDILCSLVRLYSIDPLEHPRVMMYVRETWVTNIMDAQVPTVRPEAAMLAVIDAVLASPIHGVFVTSANGRVLGLIRDTTLIQRLSPAARGGLVERSRGRPLGPREQHLLSQQSAGDVMNRSVVTLSPNASVAQALERMVNLRQRFLPIVDARQRLVGLLGQKMLLAAIVAKASEGGSA